MPARFLGVTVMPEYIQTEGIEGVLANLEKMGATAVATSPYVLEQADEQSGGREPPDDAGQGTIRLLDRPLWGRRELYIRTAPAFEPDQLLYEGLPYQPAEPTELTHTQGEIVADFVRAARGRGLKVYLQVQAAIPPGYRVQFGGPRDEDQSRLPDGSIPARRVARNGSLASDAIRHYTAALLRDLCRAYPDINGVRVDWPEYPPYSLDDCFVDFGEPARQAAGRLGFDFEALRQAARELRQHLLTRLDNATLKSWCDGGWRQWLADKPALADWLRFKATLVEELLAGFRAVLTAAAGPDMELMPNAFPPPWSFASGLDFARAAPFSSALCVKVYTMHWPMMLRGYGLTLRQANPDLDEELLVRLLVEILGMPDEKPHARLDDYAYPGPEQAHPVGDAPLLQKIEQAQQAAGTTPILTLAHSYGPLPEFERRMGTALCNRHGLWINRYGYLSDEKISRLGALNRG